MRSLSVSELTSPRARAASIRLVTDDGFTPASQYPLHDPANLIVLHLYQKMQVVVGHQAIGVEKEGSFGFLVPKKPDEFQEVIVRSENLSTIIPVIKSARKGQCLRLLRFV